MKKQFYRDKISDFDFRIPGDQSNLQHIMNKNI